MKESKKIVLIDMDGVIADFRKSFEKEVLKNGWEILEEENKMHIRVKNDNDNKRRIFINSQKGFYLNLEPIENSILAISEMLNDKNLEVFFCTTPSKKYKHCVPEKYRWIEKYFGFKATEKIIMTRDKTLVKGDFLIDDKPEILGAVKNPDWEHIYFTQPYNKNLEGLRIDDWSKWREVVK